MKNLSANPLKNRLRTKNLSTVFIIILLILNKPLNYFHRLIVVSSAAICPAQQNSKTSSMKLDLAG